MRSALLVLSIFAAAWAVLALGLAGLPTAFAALPLLISLGLVAAGWRAAGVAASGARGPHVRRVLALWSIIEVVALFIAANLLVALHRSDLVFPAAALIVGLHFFPLARGIPVPLYNWTGAGLVAVAALGLLVPAIPRAIVVSAGAALVLWATVVVIVLRARREAPAAA